VPESPRLNSPRPNSPQSFFENELPGVLRSNEEYLPQGVAVVFHIDGEGGGSWQVTRANLRDARSSVGPVETSEDPVDCEVTCSAADFMEMVRGRLDPRRAYLSGRIELLGDIGLVLRLQTMLGKSAA